MVAELYALEGVEMAYLEMNMSNVWSNVFEAHRALYLRYIINS